MGLSFTNLTLLKSHLSSVLQNIPQEWVLQFNTMFVTICLFKCDNPSLLAHPWLSCSGKHWNNIPCQPPHKPFSCCAALWAEVFWDAQFLLHPPHFLTKTTSWQLILLDTLQSPTPETSQMVSIWSSLASLVLPCALHSAQILLYLVPQIKLFVPLFRKLRSCNLACGSLPTYPEIITVAPLRRFQQLLLWHYVRVGESYAVYL